MILNNTLLPWQQQAVDKMIRLKVGALFMESGTGKTIITLELARRRAEAGKIDAVIWLCPCSAKDNIRREIVKQCPEELCSLVTICGIETLSSSIKANAYLLNLTETKSCFLVIDESLLTKNPQAYRTKNITRLAERCSYKMILNGTPISKNEADLFAQFYLLDWRILGYRSYWSFAVNHLEEDEHGKIRRVLNTEYLAEKIAPYSFEKRKRDCMELPDKQHSIRYFKLTREQWTEYGKVADRLLHKIDEFQPETVYRLFSALQAVISGKKVVFHASGAHFVTEEMFLEDPLENPRVETTVRVLRELGEEKAIVFCHYESEVTQLCRLYGPEAVRFDGQTSQKARARAIREFAGEKRYLIANKNCGGFSLNLQFCHNIVNMSNDWNLGTRLQAENRIHRLGQNAGVRIVDVCADGTIDEKILECLARKENILDGIRQAIENRSDSREAMKKCIYGSRYRHEIFDCSQLEDKDG